MVKTHCDIFPLNKTFRSLCFWESKLVFLFLAATSIFVSAVPIVTVIDDDARSAEAIETVKDVADRHGIKITFAAIASNLEQNTEVVERLRQYVEEGHEIASHSLTHSPAIWKAGAAIDIQAIDHEVSEAEKIFRRLGLHPKSFVYPYGNFSKEVRKDVFEVVGRYYDVAFNARGDINLSGKTYPLYISRHPLRKHNSLFMTKRLIDKAIAKDEAWVVLLTHSANPDFSADRLDSIIRYAQESGAVFMTASEAWQSISKWPMTREEDIPDFSRLEDYLNASYYHLPILLVAGIGLIIICGGTTYYYIRWRRNKAHITQI